MSALLLSWLIACTNVTTTIDGTVEGYSIGEAGSAYHGGPFILFTDTALDCMDASWVDRYYETEGAPTDTDLVGLQITFEGSSVSEGNYSLGGDAPLRADLIVIAGDSFETFRARDGSVVIDPPDGDLLTGTLDLQFSGNGSLSSEWTTEACVNVSE